MTALEGLQVAALVVGVGTPVMTLLFKSMGEGRWRGKIEQRLANIEAMLAREDECRDKREQNEAALHQRINKLQNRVAYLEGKRNGAAG